MDGRLILAGAAALLAAGCSRAPETPENSLAELDRELAQGAAPSPAGDPALTAALRDQIVVDPTLAAQSNANAMRPPDRPDAGAVPPDDVAAAAMPALPAEAEAPAASGACPACGAKKGALTLAALAGRQPDARLSACADAVRYSAAWANRLPRGLPLPPGARVVEAAGTDACSLRAVTFAVSASPERLVNWLYAQGTRGGFATANRANGGTRVVEGARGADAFVAYVRGRPGGGAEADLLTGSGG